MSKVAFPRIEADGALALLLSGASFEVLAQATSRDAGFTVFVLGRFGWRLGHFYRAAFCSMCPGNADEIILTISHLDLQRQWHRRNLFRNSDRGIEDEIAEYVLARIRGARRA
jgi:hypothetical protein